MSAAPGAQHALSWEIWTRAFQFRLLPSRPLLHRMILERDALGTELWDRVMRPALLACAPALFAAGADGDPRMRRIAIELRNVGASAYAAAASLYYLHGTRPEVAQTAGVAAMWLAQAAAVIDYLLDEEGLDPAVLAAHIGPDRLAAALPAPGAPHDGVPRFDAPPFDPALAFVLTAVEHGFAGLRACVALGGDDAYHHRLHDETLTCLRQMVGAELASPALRLDQIDELDEVDATLRCVNALSMRLFAYAGLLAEPAPLEATTAAVLHLAELVGRVGWTLDALDDVMVDLDHGVWNRAWLLLAQVAYRDRPAAWRDLVGRRDEALATLLSSGVIERLLVSLELARDEILGHAAVAADARAELADLCSLFIWSFLATRPPAP